MAATGTLTFGNNITGVNTGTINAQGNVVVNSGFGGGTSPLLFSGTAVQSFNLTGATSNFHGSITINKSGGEVDLASALVMSTASQNLAIQSGTLSLAGNALTVNGTSSTLIVSSGGNLQMHGDETITANASNPQLNTGSTVTYNGTGSYTGLKQGNTYSNLTFNGSGTWTLNAALTVTGNLTITQGTVDASASGCSGASCGIIVGAVWLNAGTFIARTGTVTLNGTAGTNANKILGTTTFYNLTKDVSATSADTIYFQNTNTQTIAASGTLTLKGSSGKILSIRSCNSAGVETDGTQAVLAVNNSATAAVSYVNVMDSNASVKTIGAVASTLVSGTTNWVVLTATTVTLTSSSNPARASQSVTLTATVSPSAATGTVTFLDSGVSIGTGAITAGVATLSTSSLSTGIHTLTASYGGDSSYGNSVSSSLAQAIGVSAWISGTGTWNLRKIIVISNANVSKDIPYFPLLVKISETGGASTNIGYNLGDKTTGNDIRFTSSDGQTLLPYEKEAFSDSSNNLVSNFWVQIPIITKATPTIIYMYYGNSNATIISTDWTGTKDTTVSTCTGSITKAQCVWNENGANSFKGVWHLKEATGASVADSTVNNLAGTPASSPVQGSGQIDGSLAFNGSTQSVGMGTSSPITGSTYSIQAWFNQSTDVSSSNSWYSGYMFMKGDDYTQGAEDYGLYVSSSNKSTGNLQAGITTGNGTTSPSAIATSVGSVTANTWTAISGVINAGAEKIYLNGVDTGVSGTNSHSIAAASVAMNIGMTSRGSPYSYPFRGSLDEIRLSSVARPPEWINFEYCNDMATTNTNCIVPAGGYVANELTISSSQTGNSSPGFTVGPTANSSISAPTNTGSSVSFASTATDPELDNYYFAVCRTNSITPHNNGAPTCDSGQTIIVSSSTASGSPALCSGSTCSYQTSVADSSESYPWYAFVCDYNASSMCSAATVGTPYYVNHAPLFNSSSVSNPTIAPSVTQTFTGNTPSPSDPDTATTDTVQYFACKSNDFTGSACGSAGTWCSSSLVSSNPSCNYTIQSSDGLGTKNYFGYIVDKWGFASSVNPISGTFVISGTGSSSYIKLGGKLQLSGNLLLK